MTIHLLHGAMGRPNDWDEFEAGLLEREPDAKVRAHDLFGMLADESIELGEAAARLAREFLPGDIAVGYSLGGRLLLHAALAGFTSGVRFVFVSTHTGIADIDADGRSERRRRDALWAERLRSSASLGEILDAWDAQPVLSGGARADRPPDDLLWRERAARSFECWGLAEQCDLLPEFLRVGSPTTWLVGERDPKFSRLADRVREEVGAEVLTVPAVGHRIPWEAPDFLLGALLKIICSS